jgi:hypothetical protein
MADKDIEDQLRIEEEKRLAKIEKQAAKRIAEAEN